MRAWFRPTLVRRVLLALLLAHVGVWLALVIFSYTQHMDVTGFDADLHATGTAVAQSIAELDDAKQIHAFANAMEMVQNERYRAKGLPMVLAIQVWGPQQEVVFGSGLVELSTLQDASNSKGGSVELGGRRYSIFRSETPKAQIVVALSAPTTGWALMSIARELLPYMLIGFVIVSVPISIAVSQGLRPLREMSQRIAARHPDDLSATGVLAKYEEMRPLQQALDNLLAKLRNKVARETAFVQEAAHELRTPFAVVSAQAHVLRLAPDASARQVAEQHLDAALARSSHLIGQLLQLAQLGGERALQLVPVDLAQDIRHELALLVPSAQLRHIDLSMESPDSLHLRTERHTFASILHNLVGNAIRYVNAGDSIVVSLVAQGDHVVFTVADDGPGIALDLQAQVFERFHRGQDHATPGAGLGLSIVRQACMRLGGTVSLQAGLSGRGCAFVVRLARVA